MRHLGMATTRAQAVNEKLAAIMAMLESQQGTQEELLARTSELSEQQQKSREQFVELQRVRRYVEEIGESLETRVEAAEKKLAATVEVEPRRTEDSHTPGLRISAQEFRASEGTTVPASGWTADETDGVDTPPIAGVGSGDPGRSTAAAPTLRRDTLRDSAAARMVRPAPYDGTSPWDAYKAQFELLAELNSWTDAEKATFLAINLRGSALSLLGNLPPRSRTDYAALTEALDCRFGVAHQAELNRTRLRIRRRRRDEGLPELAEDVERLTRLAYPDADRTLLELLAKDQFIDAL